MDRGTSINNFDSSLSFSAWLSCVRFRRSFSPWWPPRLRRIVTCIVPNQKNQPNLDLYLVRRYKICHFPIVVSYLCIGQNQKNKPNLVLYLVRRSKIFVSVATLVATALKVSLSVWSIFSGQNLADNESVDERMSG